MNYTYKVCFSEKEMLDLVMKMRGQKPYFIESFAHVDNITIERMYKREMDQGPWRECFLLTMPYEKGVYSSLETIRQKVKDDFRTGKLSFPKRK